MSDDTLPRRLGPYRLEEILGRGGMGVVYSAWDTRLERRVALKRVPADLDAPQRRARLRREARLAAQLAHPAVVRVFDLLEEDDADWIVLEHVEGRSLAELLRDGPLDIDRALRYGRQIAEGLAAAHGLEIVHRDLKTENVIVEAHGFEAERGVKILDFGLAKQLPEPGSSDASELSIAGRVMGTGRAMSPEQARGLEVGPRSDLFSLGVLLYECLSGVSPFRGETLQDTLVRVATHPAEPLDELVPTVPRQLATLVERLLSKAPELRPAGAREVAADLRRIKEERSVNARRETSVDPPDFAPDTATQTADITVVEPVRPAQPAAGATAPGPHRARTAARPKLMRVGLAGLGLTGLGLAAISFHFSPSPEPSIPRETIDATTAPDRSPKDPLALYEEGMRAVRRSDWPESIDRATKIFLRLLELDGTSAAAHAGLARAYWQKAESQATGGDPVFLDNAASAAGEAVRLDPYLADARVALGLVLLSQGQTDAAQLELDEALTLDPSNADAYFGLAKLAQISNAPELAESHFRQALALRQVPRYHDELGSLLFARGRFAEAEDQFLASLELAPDNVYALRNLGGVYFALDRLDEAAARFQEALKIRGDASLYSNLGAIFYLRGLYPKAAAAFESALRTAGATHKHIFWLNLADAYRQVPGKEEAAHLHYRRAIELLGEDLADAPDNARLLGRRAQALARDQSCEAAQRDVERLRASDLELGVYPLFQRAVAEELCGARNAALESIAQALRSGLPEAEVRRELDLLELRADPRFHLLVSAEDG